jgi:hypothetical protein
MDLSYMSNIIYLCVLFILLAVENKAQLPAAGGQAAVPDTSLYADRVQRRWTAKRLFIPVTCIAYGIASLHNSTLKDLNEGTRDEVWDEHEHPLLKLDDYLQWAPAIAVYGLNLAGIKGKSGFIDRSLIYGISMTMVTVIVQAGKRITREWRPDLSDNNSFPSGHTATAFASAEFLRIEFKDVSPWYGVAGYAVAVATGWLRVYNDKHWLSDVVAGAGIGILSTDFAYHVYPLIKRTFEGHKKVHNKQVIIYPFYRQGAVGLGIVKVF